MRRGVETNLDDPITRVFRVYGIQVAKDEQEHLPCWPHSRFSIIRN